MTGLATSTTWAITECRFSVALPEHFAAILAAYRTQMTLVNDEVTVPMPASASLTIASGFRNPRRNKAAGSVHNSQGDISRHVLGSALDLVPDGVSVLINNKQVPLQWDDNLYPALCAAASSLGLHVLPEEGCCDIVDCGTDRRPHARGLVADLWNYESIAQFSGPCRGGLAGFHPARQCARRPRCDGSKRNQLQLHDL